MPPSPRLSSRMMKATYFTLTTRISAHTISERTPYTAAGVAGLEGADLGLVAERQRDLVLTRQQHLLAKRIDVEAVHRTVGRRDGLGLEIDGDRCSRSRVELAPQRRHGRGGKDDREQAVLEAVLMEDVAETGRDDGTDPEGVERPHRHLARRAAAEVLRRDHGLRRSVGGLVQDELRFLRAVGLEAYIVEQKERVVGTPWLAEKPGRNDAVGVHVRQIDRRGDRGQSRGGAHGVAATPARHARPARRARA